MRIVNIRPKIGQKIETQKGLPPTPVEVAPEWHREARCLLAQDATEAQRMAYGGRSLESLSPGKCFDSDRIESMPLFAPARKQARLL